MQWSDVLNAECYCINRKTDVDKFQQAVSRLQEAGFSNIKQYVSVEEEEILMALAENPQSYDAFRKLPCDAKMCQFFNHFELWRYLIVNNIPYAIIFEDDVEFHDDWTHLAEVFWKKTPKDFNILFFGNDLPNSTTCDDVEMAVVKYTRGYMVTLQGAKELYNSCAAKDVFFGSISDFIHHDTTAKIEGYTHWNDLVWYVWNSRRFPQKGKKMSGLTS
jgi:hypothetical protein